MGEIKSKLDYTKDVLSSADKEIIKNEVCILKMKYPNHIPIIVRSRSEQLQLRKNKYLVSATTDIALFLNMVKRNTNMSSHDSVFFFANDEVVPLSMTAERLYERHKDQTTGLMFLTMYKENTFGELYKENTFGELYKENTFGELYKENTFGEQYKENVFI
jgi:hypothetical protein